MASVLVVDDSADTVAMLAFHLKGQLPEEAGVQ